MSPALQADSLLLSYQESPLNLNIRKRKIIASGPITLGENKWETMETVTDFLSWAPKSLQMMTTAMEVKISLLLGRKAINKPRQHINK